MSYPTRTSRILPAYGAPFHYEISATIAPDNLQLWLNTRNAELGDFYPGWNSFIRGHSRQEIKALEAEMEKLTCAPTSVDELGEAWFPFASERILPATAWQMWVDSFQQRFLSISLVELGIPIADIHMGRRNSSPLICSYRGVISGTISSSGYHISSNAYCLLLLLDGELRPTVKASRSTISNMPLELIVAICGILSTWVVAWQAYASFSLLDWSIPQLLAWRRLRGTKLERWLEDNLHDYVERILDEFSQPILPRDEEIFCIGGALSHNNSAVQTFFMASMQETYQMKVNYEEGQIITVSDKVSEEAVKFYDLFPPMMFCSAATQLSRRYLCSEDRDFRRCITADHPYAMWLLKNAAALNEYFIRQFQEVVSTLRDEDSKYIIKICNSVREQLLSLPEHHGADIAACPKLSQADFWAPEDKSASVSD